MKKEKAAGRFSLLVWLALVVCEVWLGFRIYQLNMLPTKYLLVVLALLALTAVILGMIMRQKKGKYQQNQRSFSKVVGYILSLLIIAGCLVGSGAVGKIYNTISSVTSAPDIRAVVDIYVRNDDTAQAVEDAAGYTFAVTDAYDWEHTQLTLTELENTFGHPVSTIRYATVAEMVDALYAKQVDALILNSSYVGILVNLDKYADFSDQTRILHEHSIENTTEGPGFSISGLFDRITSFVKSGFASKEDKSFIVYLSGSDTRRQTLSGGNSDVNILAVVNTKTKQVLLVNTPRDYYVVSPASPDGDMDKLTHCGVYGPECSMEALANLYNIEIQYYAEINFTGFKTLIDAIGGVDVENDVAFGTGDAYFDDGTIHLNGEKALIFARARKQLAGGDNARGRNQMKIITGVIKKLSSGSTILSNYSEILASLDGLFTTSFTPEEISELVKMQLDDMEPWNIQSYAVTGTGGSDTTYATGGLYAYVMYPHEETVAKASELINRVLNGETLTAEDVA